MAVELTEAELLESVPANRRPTKRQLKRLRDECLIPKPRLRGRGRAAGITAVYPETAVARLRRVVELQGAGVRAMRDLRWWLWFEGGDELWTVVKRDLLASYPRADMEQALRLRERTDEEATDEIDRAQQSLAAEWQESRYPPFDRRRVRGSADADSLAAVVLGEAFPQIEARLEDAVEESDDEESAETYSNLADRAWGEGTGETMAELERAGVADFTKWESALLSADESAAREMASLWSKTFDPRALKREFEFFGRDWADRATMVAGTLFAIEALRGGRAAELA